MERWKGKVALVTGASSGIGAAICRELVKHGLIVFGCGKDVEKINDLAEEEVVKSAPGNLHAIKCDMTDEDDILYIFAEIRWNHKRIDICICSEGFSTNKSILTEETSDWRTLLMVNVLAPCICSREAVNLMRDKNIDDGQIIQISSIAGSSPFYCGTKAMFRTLNGILINELSAIKSPIRLAVINSTRVETETLTTTSSEDADDIMEIPIRWLQPKDIVDAVIYILESPPHMTVSNITMQSVEH